MPAPLVAIPGTSRWVVISAVLGALGCTGSEPPANRDSSRVAQSPPGQAAGPDTSSAEPDRAHWTVTATGLGPLRAGASIAHAGRMLGETLRVAGVDTACGYADPVSLPPGVLLMFTNGTLARVDITTNVVRTDVGAGVGDSEARIDSLYRGRVTVEPHEYTDGHYLVVRAASRPTPDHRLVFETDGALVTRYRAGRMPEVTWVEGCS